MGKKKCFKLVKPTTSFITYLLTFWIRLLHKTIRQHGWDIQNNLGKELHFYGFYFLGGLNCKAGNWVTWIKNNAFTTGSMSPSDVLHCFKRKHFCGMFLHCKQWLISICFSEWLFPRVSSRVQRLYLASAFSSTVWVPDMNLISTHLLDLNSLLELNMSELSIYAWTSGLPS